MVFHWSLSDNKSPQILGTLLNILADFNNAVVFMVCTRPLISKSSSFFYQSFSDCTKRTYWYHRHTHAQQFFQLPSKVQVFLLLFASFKLYSMVTRYSVLQVLFFCWLLQGLVVWPRLGDPFISGNPRDVCASHSAEQILGCAYTICSYSQILISCTDTRGSPCLPNCV